jgi:3-oxoacyl-[acyl-carrier protein] reductase
VIAPGLSFGFGESGPVVVTGAGSGIGRAVVLRAVEMGLPVSAWDHDDEALAETMAAVAAGATVHACVVDVTDPDGVRRGFEEARARLGPVALLANNAGPSSATALGFAEGMTAALGSVRLVTEVWAGAALPPGAAMVATASVAGNLIGTGSDWYSAAKAAVMGYVRHLAAYRAAEFRSNAVAPGMTDTPRLSGFRDSEVGRRSLERNPLGRMATPDEIALAILFLLSPAASYINGVLLPVDGGWTITQ